MNAADRALLQKIDMALDQIKDLKWALINGYDIEEFDKQRVNEFLEAGLFPEEENND